MSWEQAKAERDFRTNPPTDAPMQGENSGWDDMEVGSSSVENVADSYSSNISDTLNSSNPSMMGNNQMVNQGMQRPNQPKSAEDVAFDAVVGGTKGLYKFTKLLVQSFRNNKPGDWYRLGDRIIKVSVSVIVVGIFGCIYKAFNPNNNMPIDCVIGGLFSLIPGVFLSTKFTKEDIVEEQPVIEEPMPSYDYADTSNDWSSDDDDVWDDIPEEEDSGSDWDDLSGDDGGWGNVMDSMDYGDSLFEGVNDSSFDASKAVEDLPDITPGAYTRQYLVESFMKVLPLVSPNYAVMKEITSDCDQFYVFEDYLRSAAYQLGMKEEKIPELERLHENAFLFRLTCTRPSGMKEQLIADEIAMAFSRDDNNRVYKFGVYATVECQPGVCSINIFKGFEKDAMGNEIGGVKVSLGDIYRQITPFISNTQIQMPFVWGVNEFGEALYCDMKDNNSIIISGLPRGGKSWKGQSWVAQMCMFQSPKEVELYFFDGKDKSSDYIGLSKVLPHAKYFCGDMDKFNDGIEAIMKKMDDEVLPRITDAGYINIKDYNKNNPMNKIPYTYIVIDELMSLMDHYKKADNGEDARFRGNISTLVSKYPNSGLRFVLFPHRIVNDIISKNTYTLVSCRVVVKQTNFDELKNALEVKEKDFHYQLAQTGDMAIKVNEINNGVPVYCHAEMLASDNSGNARLFDYIGSVWKKLEPDCECITLHKDASSGKYVGGNITANGRVIYGSSNKGSGNTTSSSGSSTPRVPNKPARDVTAGKESYKYDSFSSGSGLSELEEEGAFEGFDNGEESFWDDILSGESGMDDSEEVDEGDMTGEVDDFYDFSDTVIDESDKKDDAEDAPPTDDNFWDDF